LRFVNFLYRPTNGYGLTVRTHGPNVGTREIMLFTVRARARSIRRARWLYYVAVARLDSLSACYLNGAYSGNLCGVLGLPGLSVTVTVSDFIRSYSRRSGSGCYSRIAIRPHRSKRFISCTANSYQGTACAHGQYHFMAEN